MGFSTRPGFGRRSAAGVFLAGALVLWMNCSATVFAEDLQVHIVNTSSTDPSGVYVMLHGGNSSDGQLQADTPRTLDQLRDNRFTLAPNSGVARIYFSFQKPVTVGEPFTSTTRFDWVELFYGPPAVSVANLTAVDQFGIPLALEALGGSSGSRSWNTAANAIVATLAELAPGAVIQSATGEFVRVQSPTHSPSSYPSWQPYLNSLAGQTVTLVDVFSKQGQPPTQIHYSGTFGPDATIRLSGTLTQNGKPIAGNADLTIYGPKPPFPPPTNPGIPQITFSQQVYPANGPYFLSDHPATYHTAGANNAYSVIYRDLMSGLNNGFLGGKYGNSSTDWLEKPAFAAARTTNDGYYDQYAARVQKLSGGQIYGYAFSDNTSDPLMTITNSSTLRIHILADDQKFPRPSR
jgi:hypothetical protein